MFFQIKKIKQGNNPLTKKVQDMLASFGLKYYSL
jgi:hypothetical protein